MRHDILEIKKYDEKISKSVYVIYNDAKLIALSGLALFACEKGILDYQATNVFAVGGVSVGTLATISLVKSICNIYLNNNKKKELENAKYK